MRHDCDRRRIEDPHWSSESGGIGKVSPRPFIHGYIYCNEILDGEIAHSCSHGRGPHRIKVCFVQADNKQNRGLFQKLKTEADTKEERYRSHFSGT